MPQYWTPSTWDTKLIGFCESNLYTKHEIVNTISSLFIISWGAYGLYQLPSPIYQSADVWQIIYSLIVCVGFGSIGQHWTAQIGWSLMDSFPMLLTEFIALFYLISLGLKIKISNQTHIQKQKYINNSKQVAKVMGIIMLSFGVLSVSVRCVYGGSRSANSNIFETIFGSIPVVIFILCIWAACDKSLLRKKINQSPQYKLVFRHLWKGYAVALIAGILWNVTENFCDDVQWLKYVPMHGIWHFAVSYGFYSIIQAAIYVDFDINFDVHSKKHFKVKIMQKKDGKNRFAKVWYASVPVLYFYKRNELNTDYNNDLNILQSHRQETSNDILIEMINNED